MCPFLDLLLVFDLISSFIDNLIAQTVRILLAVLMPQLTELLTIVIDNLLVYINTRIPATIKEEGHIIYYLLLYLLDFNLIKLI